MDYKDYYAVMGVARDATQDEIKRAYRKLARKFHPDVSKAADAEVRFKELGEAYEVLKDPEKRAAYDQLGRNWQAGQDFRPPPDWDAGFEFSGGGHGAAGQRDFSDFFESLFGR
ncbi:MAG: DnaJ domain-containing protein, partial [Gammaproteobacteria bacterium]|nr:DnaJ domain-containing protein [Gammaproteobacteria bacterium]